MTAIHEIVRRCNSLNSEIGSFVQAADKEVFLKSVLTSGGYVLTVPHEAIQDQQAGSLSDESIMKIVETAKKRKI